jgi:hypothetical protein
MTISENTPRNEVERLLLEMMEGRIEPENFARDLLNHQVFMPIRDEKHQIAGFQLSTKAQPLVAEDEDGNRVLVVFSAPERAKEFSVEYPDYSGGLLSELHWVVRRMGANMGLSINPGQELGFDFDPEMVAMLASLLPEESV